jgi:hypothetical protein
MVLEDGIAEKERKEGNEEVSVGRNGDVIPEKKVGETSAKTNE